MVAKTCIVQHESGKQVHESASPLSSRFQHENMKELHMYLVNPEETQPLFLCPSRFQDGPLKPIQQRKA